MQSSAPNVRVLNYADDTVIIGLCSNANDEQTYKTEVGRIVQLCHQQHLLLNAAKTKELVFTTQRAPMQLEMLNIGGTDINTCDTVKYLGLYIDSDLKFEHQTKSICSKARQRLYIVSRFYKLGMRPVYLSLLFKCFILSTLMYCTPVYYQHLSASNKAIFNKIFKIVRKIGIKADFSKEYEGLFKNYVLRSFHGEDHFIHQVLERMPSGRFRAVKWRTTAGRGSFIRNAVHLLNEIFFGS